jgi:hypothetical protein
LKIAIQLIYCNLIISHFAVFGHCVYCALHFKSWFQCGVGLETFWLAHEMIQQKKEKDIEFAEYMKKCPI